MELPAIDGSGFLRFMFLMRVGIFWHAKLAAIECIFLR